MMISHHADFKKVNTPVLKAVITNSSVGMSFISMSIVERLSWAQPVKPFY